MTFATKVVVRVTQFQDRRTLEQLRHSDSIDEKRWRARVRLNEQRRRFRMGSAR